MPVKKVLLSSILFRFLRNIVLKNSRVGLQGIALFLAIKYIAEPLIHQQTMANNKKWLKDFLHLNTFLDLQLRIEALEQRLAALQAKSKKNTTTEWAKPVNPISISTAELPDLTLPPADLTAIKGIGKVIAEKLRGLGITSFKQVAELTDDQIAYIESEIGFVGRAHREQWREQAKAMLGK